MKKVLFLIVSFCILVCGCSVNNNQTPKEPVVINHPQDDTVNGYRKEDSTFPDKIKADEVLPDNSNSITTSYCGNKNSKKFHKTSCSALKNTKDENKVYFANRTDFIDKGYEPCKMCNP